MFYLMMHSTHFIDGYMASDYSDSETWFALSDYTKLSQRKKIFRKYY